MSDTAIIPPLRPCPFCGANQCSIALQQLPDGDVLYYCEECNVTGGDYSSEAEAHTKWNTRPIEDELALTVEKLLDSIREERRIGRIPVMILGDGCILIQEATAALANARGGGRG